MHKKISAIFFVAIFLITSIGVISAADDVQSINVKIVWNGNSDNLPSSMTVSLIKDGSVVDSAVLSSSNSWSTTFKASSDGNYQVKSSGLQEYSTSISGNAQRGFVITNTLLKSDDDVLSSDNNKTENKPAVNDDNLTNETLQDSNSTEETVISNFTNETATANNTANSTQNSTTQTINKTNISKDNKTPDTPSSTDKEKVKEVIKKVAKKEPKKNDAKKLRQTGLPIAILVVAIFVAAFIPFRREK